MKVKNYPLGGTALALQGISMVGNVIGAIGANKRAKREAMLAERANLNNTREQDAIMLDDYNDSGNEILGYYKHGGNMHTLSKSITGGKAIPLSSDSVIMKGKTHENGGIMIGDNVEVENDEVIQGNKVFSDTLKAPSGKTYAEEAERLARKKGELESNPNDDIFAKNTKQRRMQILDAEQNKLFEMQEASKTKGNNTSYLKEGGFAKTLSQGIPFLDNAVNAGLTLMTPKTPRPQYIKARQLDTNVNVAPQLNEVTKAADSTSRVILENTNNSAAARNAIGRTKLRAADSKARILANKENQETNLRNANTRNAQFVDQINAGKTDRYRQQSAARKANIIGKISGNVANLADDVIDRRNFDEGMRFNNERLATIKTMYNSGVVSRTDSAYLEELRKLLNK